MFKDVNKLPVLDKGVNLGFTDVEGLIQPQLKKVWMKVAVRQQINFNSLPLTTASILVDSHSSAQKWFTITLPRIAEVTMKEARLNMRRYASALSESLNDSQLHCFGVMGVVSRSVLFLATNWKGFLETNGS